MTDSILFHRIWRAADGSDRPWRLRIRTATQDTTETHATLRDVLSAWKAHDEEIPLELEP